ncbi:MAG TPA: B12-binding domain-containing protein [Burkholderiales bacterium]|jgi:methanogenic corrinoid protein MtbC1|nr:B12-binding domain-containing protein [Burkholderiales bacterium]
MDETIESIKARVVAGRRAETLQAIEAALAQGLDSMTIMSRALIPAMSIVGEKYSSGEFFLPQRSPLEQSPASPLLCPHGDWLGRA